MAGGMDLGTGGRGGRKPVDATINLVPFIDLMAVTISFLIMTAVWNQTARLEAQSGAGGGDGATDEHPLRLEVTGRGFRISSGGSAVELPRREGRYVICHATGSDAPAASCDEGSLVSALQAVKVVQPDRRAIAVEFEDQVLYSDVVRVLDACNLKDAARRPALFPEISVAGAL